MSSREVQAILDAGVSKGWPSPLASYEEAGQSASELIVKAATGCRINPKVLLALLETKTGLVTGDTANNIPGSQQVDPRLGPNCDQGSGTCDRPVSTLDPQLRQTACHYRDLWDGGYEAVTTWRKPGDAVSTRDGIVHPINKATLLLYLDLEQLASGQPRELGCRSSGKRGLMS